MRKPLLGLLLLASPAWAIPTKTECARDANGYLHCTDVVEQRSGKLMISGEQRLQQAQAIKAMINAGNCPAARRYAATTDDHELKHAVKEACSP